MRRIFSYFNLNQRERTGLIALQILLFVFLLLSFLIPIFQKRQPITYELIQWESDTVQKYAESISSPSATRTKPATTISYFYFDPNILTKQEWMRLGISEKQAQVILNYVQKGGRFRKKEDLFKIYSLSKQEVERLLPYVSIAETLPNQIPNIYKPSHSNPIKPKELLAININLADSLQFESLHGIGPAYARRIINFREALGGFYNIQQLKEVYGIPAELIDHLAPQLQIQGHDLRKIIINQSSTDELGKHPYIKYKRAKLIVAYRNQHGSFQSIEDLKKIHSLDDDFFTKIEPYLDFSL